MPAMPMLRRQATSLPGDKTDFVAKHTSFLLSLESRIQSILLYGVSETLEVGMKRSITHQLKAGVDGGKFHVFPTHFRCHDADSMESFITRLAVTVLLVGGISLL